MDNSSETVDKILSTSYPHTYPQVTNIVIHSYECLVGITEKLVCLIRFAYMVFDVVWIKNTPALGSGED